MPRSKNFPCEIRLAVTEDVRNWLQDSASKSSEPVTTFVRGLIVDVMEKSQRSEVCRSTDPLIRSMVDRIEVMSERIEVISEKLGVELPERQPDSEGEISAEKEG